MLSVPFARSEQLGHSSRRWAALRREARKWAVARVDRASVQVCVDVPPLERALRTLDPTLSLCRVRARVEAVRDETPDVKTYVLRPNARFGSFRPGSYVTLRLSIEGTPVERAYSLSSAPSRDGLIAITIKRVPGGKVSNWLSDTVRVGDVIELSAPQGQFLLPREPAPRLLMMSAGSGITPVMSMLRQLVAQGAPNDVAFLHFARSPRDIIFREELEQIARSSPQVRLALCVEQADAGWRAALGRFSQSLLEQVVPDFREREAYLCGPSGFMAQVLQTLERAGADLSKLRYERFSANFDASAVLEQAQEIRFLRSGIQSISNHARTILEQAENLGLPVQSGCRAGNCGTCRCRKKRGVVVDVTTGRASGDGEELIYPCVSLARGTVEIDL